MLRSKVIFVLGCYMAATGAFGADAGLYVRGEYRQDARDYESSSSRFYRLASSLVLSESSSFNATLVRNADGGETHTWSLVLADASPRLYLLAGNYTAAFGGGLFLGRPRAYMPDLFSWRSANEEKNVFSPVKSGNPSYAFNGVAVSYRLGDDAFALGLHSFYSISPRYIGEDGYFSAATDNSLGTIQTSLERDCAHSEPANIHTGGIMLSLVAAGLFLVEPYYVYTDLATPRGGTIRWDNEEREGVEGAIRNIHGAGLMLRYRDERLSVYLDSAMSATDISEEKRGTRRSTGSGVICGIRFHHPLLSFSSAYKHTSPDFNAPYQSTVGEQYPERGCFFEAEARPARGVTVGASYAAQKKLAPASADWELPYTTREKYLIRYSGTVLKNAEIYARRYEKTSRGASIRSEQGAVVFRIGVFEPLSADASFIGQRTEREGKAFLAKGGVSAEIVSGGVLSLHYARSHVTGGERLYGTVSPMAGSSIPGMFITSTADIMVVKIAVRGGKLDLAGRYFQQWSRGETAHRRMEFTVSGTF